MNDNIIIYTKYFSEAVIEILNTFDLNVTVLCLSRYDQVLHYVKTTPNLLGVIFVEYKPSMRIAKAYNEILTALDEIAESSKKTLCVSVLSNTDSVQKVISGVKTTHIDIMYKKFTFFNTDILRYEGLVTVIYRTIGLTKQTAVQTLHSENVKLYSDSSKSDLFKACMLLCTLPLEDLDSLEQDIGRFPELRKLRYLREFSDKDEEYLNGTEHSIFTLFFQQCIERRREEQLEMERGY